MLPTLAVPIGEAISDKRNSSVLSIIRNKDDSSGENDAEGITSFVYKDRISNEGVMVDCGASPAMRRDPAPLIAGLLQRHNVKNVCLSHGHFDHINGLHLLDKCKTVHMSRLADRYAYRELERHGRGPQFKKRIFIPNDEGFSAKDHLSIGPFSIVPILVPHSISESCMLLIIGNGRIALHQGDAKMKGVEWQEEFRLRSCLSQIGEFGLVDVMHVDNLNCHRHGFTAEESGVCRSLGKIIETTKGRIVIGVFATNLRRIEAVSDTAMKLYRSVQFVGSSMRFAKELLEEEGGRFPRRRTGNPVVFTSGCQGEPDSILWREAQETGGQLGLGKGDTVIFSSHKIPGNTQRISSTVKNLLAKGCRVIVNQGEIRGLRLDPHQNLEEAFVHVSGHGQRGDVETVLDMVKPRSVIPSIRRGPQIRALKEICAARNIEIVEPVDNCFVL